MGYSARENGMVGCARWKDSVRGVIARTVGRGDVCTMQLESGRQVFTVTSKDLQPLANVSQMYNGTGHTSQVSPCDWYSV